MDLLSASQISKYRGCARQWGWRYIAQLPDPSGPAAALGTEVDDTQLQPYLRDDRPIDFSRDSGYIAASGLAFLPRPKSHGMELQKHFVMPSPTWHADGEHIGFGYQGYIDLWMPDGGMPDITGAPVVCDFKTTGNWKYVKTTEQLKVDVQAQLYATWAMYKTKSKIVDLVWVYMATKGPRKAKRVHLRVHADDVAEQFTAINETAVEMYDVRQTVTDPMELKPNPEMCDAYGGCPYRHKCNLGPGEKIDAAAAQYARQNNVEVSMSNAGTSGLLARLRQAREGGTPVGGVTGYDLSAKQLDGQAAADKGIESVGINPPESKLAPAPAVGVAVAPAAVIVDAPKRVGRPRKVAEATPGQAAANALVVALSAPPAAIDAYEAVITKTIDQEDRAARIGRLAIELFAELSS